MGKKFDFDYIIIGGGPAGATIALALAKNKKKKIGIVKNGVQDNSPYLTSLNFAHNFYNLKNFPELAGQDFHYNLPTIASNQEKIAELTEADNKKLYKEAGISYMKGSANFLDKYTIAVGSKKITSKIFILATGSKLNSDNIFGADSADYFTPETILKVRRLPKFILIIGGGSTGCELAEYFTKLNAKVILMEKEDRILPKEDMEASESLCDYFEHELGIMVIKKCRVLEIANEGNTKRIIFSTDEGEKMIRVDCVVLATGYKPDLNLGLENAGVRFNKNGVLVDRFLQTSARNIFALGDCIASDLSAERADHEARVLINNFLRRSKNPVNKTDGFTRITTTEPEIAAIGKTETSLIRNKIKYKKSVIYLKDIPASKIYHEKYGFVKILTDKNNRIIGATIMAPHASLMIAELATAIRCRLTAREIAKTPHNINDFGYAIKLAAKNIK